MELKLREGFMSSKEIAVWFGKTYDVYKHRSKDLLNELKFYADFDKIHGGVNVKSIEHPVYLSLNENQIEIIGHVKEAPGHLVSGAGISRKMKLKNKNINEESSKRKNNKDLNYLFGKLDREVSRNEFNQGGVVGCRKKVWAIKESKYNKYRLLTEEEKEIFHSLISNKIGPKDVGDIYNIFYSLLDEDIDNEKYEKAFEKAFGKTFGEIIYEFREITGEQLASVSECKLKQEFEG